MDETKEDSTATNEANGADWTKSKGARGFSRVLAKIFGGGEEEEEEPDNEASGANEGSLQQMLRAKDNEDEDYKDEDYEEKKPPPKVSAAHGFRVNNNKHEEKPRETEINETLTKAARKPTDDVTMIDPKEDAKPPASGKPDDEVTLAQALMKLQTAKKDSKNSNQATNKRPRSKDTQGSPTRQKKAPTNTVPLVDFMQQSRVEVVKAGALVSRTLQSGPWPSPYRSFDPQDRASHNYRAHAMHFSMIGASLEKFTNDIIAQSLMEELNNTPRPKRAESRAFMGTLLLLREAMILNAMEIFGSSAFLTGKEPDFGESLSGLTDEVAEEDVAAFSVKILVTTVILAGISELGNEESEGLSSMFLDLVGKYDRSDRELVACLECVGQQEIPIFPNRQKMLDQERRAWQISYNTQREEHPLFTKEGSVQSTAVHVSILQQSENSSQ